jgi:DNA-binding transcriptional regulator YbjK
VRLSHLPGWLLVLSLSAALSCQTTPINDPLPLPPLAEGTAISLDELLIRARTQATRANEAFYVDDWATLEQAAIGLAATANRIPTSQGLLPDRKTEITAKSADLGLAASALQDAAKSKNVDLSTQLLQRIHRAVRDLQRVR